MTTLGHPGITATRTRKSITILAFAAIAMLAGVMGGLVYNLPASDPAWRAPTQFTRTHFAPATVNARRSEQRRDAGDQVGALRASQIVPCIMPPAWRRGCESSSLTIAAK